MQASEEMLSERVRRGLLCRTFPASVLSRRLEQIEEQDWSLNPGRYVGHEASHGVDDIEFFATVGTAGEEAVRDFDSRSHGLVGFRCTTEIEQRYCAHDSGWTSTLGDLAWPLGKLGDHVRTARCWLHNFTRAEDLPRMLKTLPLLPSRNAERHWSDGKI